MAPDLEMRIYVNNLSWNRAKKIAQATQVEGVVPISAERRWLLFHDLSPLLHTLAVHDLLDELANWDADTWDMESEKLPGLVRTMEILFAQIAEEFAVEVIWVSDTAREEVTISRPEMLDVVRRGKVGTRTRYRIQPA